MKQRRHRLIGSWRSVRRKMAAPDLSWLLRRVGRRMWLGPAPTWSARLMFIKPVQ